MNYRWDKKYLYYGVTAFLVIAASSVFFLILSNLESVTSGVSAFMKFMQPIIYGFVMAYLLTPIMNFFEKKVLRRFFTKVLTRKGTPPDKFKVNKLARGFGVAVTMTLAMAFIVGLISAVLPQLITTAQTMSNSMSQYISSANKWLLSILDDYPDLYESLSTAVTQLSETFKVQIQDMVLPQMTALLTNVSSGILTTISAFFNIILGFIICIYFLYSKELFAAQAKKILYGLTNRRNANLVIRNMRQVHKTFGGFITGKIIDSLIIGLITFIVLTVFNMPYTLIVSIFVGVTNFIPYFGPFIGAIPSAFLILLVDPFKCLQFVIIIIIIQQFDGNILGPKILGDNTGLSSFWVIFSILAGREIFGFVGFVIGVPLFAVIYALTKGHVSRKLKSKGMPVDTNLYRDLAHYDIDTGEPITLTELQRIEAEQRKQSQATKKPPFWKKTK